MNPVASISAAATAAAAPLQEARDTVSTREAGFGQVMEALAESAIGSLKAGETAAIAGIEGKLPVQDVVEAAMSAERSFQTAIAIRDKVVSAYLEMTRMQI